MHPRPDEGRETPDEASSIFAAQHQFLSRNRPHTEGLNAFFSRLHYSARNHSEISVSRLEKDHWITGIEPDGKGEIAWGDGTTLPFWLEHDRGTETLAYLARKIKSYRDRTDRNPDLRRSVLLIELPSERRLRNFLPIGSEAWKQDVPDWDNPTLVVAVCASNLNERTFARQEQFPDAFTDRRWNILGWTGVYSLTELPAIPQEIRSPNTAA